MTHKFEQQISRERIQSIRTREDQTFADRTRKSAALAARAKKNMPGSVPMAWMSGLYRTPPLFIAHGEGSRFFDVDGNAYLDFNVADLAMTMGYGPEPIAAAVTEQISKGAHFLLPTEDSIEVAEELASRSGLPFWQFTLSASGANTEVIRISRFLTGREKVVVFRGHYHGHIDETLVSLHEDGLKPDLLGLPASAGRHTIELPFNDLDALASTLKSEEIALVITEPALTNCNVVLPEPGFLTGIRELTERYGAFLCYDEAHTYQFAYGGLTRAWQLDCDFQVIGKGMGTGVSFAVYGMTAEIGKAVESHIDIDTGPAGLATGGTTYASALATAAAKAALQEVLTETNYRTTARLGERLASGLDDIFARHSLDWKAFHIGPRSGYCMRAQWPSNYEEAEHSLDDELIDARRVFMANRGIWDAVASAGPQASFAHDENDVDTYLAAADAFIGELVAR